MYGTVNKDIAPVNALHVRMVYAKVTRIYCPNAKKYSITIPVNKRLRGPTEKFSELIKLIKINFTDF